MIIALLGASGSGKSTVEKHLNENYGYEKIISYTTRSPRVNENDGVDYNFITNDEFKKLIDEGKIAEYDEYSQGRLYGTLKEDYTSGDKVVVLTPNGFRQLKQMCGENISIMSVLINATLGTRVKRYIDRCGVDNFNFDDKNEIAARVERDFGMFLGLEKEVDIVMNNNENTDMEFFVKLLIAKIKTLSKERGLN